MLQFRRVIEITNIICNYIFLVFLLLFGIYVSSLWTTLDEEFVAYVVQLDNIVGWTVIDISLALLLCAIILLFVDHTFKFGIIFFSLIRTFASAILMFAIDALVTVINSGLVVKI